MNELAVAFVKLALALGEHDSDYVDAYHGPKQWREQAKNMALSLQQIQSQSTQHASALNKLSMEDGSAKKRGQFLSKGFHSLQTRAAIVAGKALALGERVEKFRKDFIIPAEKLDFVFQAAFSAA